MIDLIIGLISFKCVHFFSYNVGFCRVRKSELLKSEKGAFVRNFFQAHLRTRTVGQLFRPLCLQSNMPILQSSSSIHRRVLRLRHSSSSTFWHQPSHFCRRPFLMGGFFWGGYKQSFFRFQVSYCPVKSGSRAGSSRNESDYSRRGTRISFPLLEGHSCDNFGLLIALFSIV